MAQLESVAVAPPLPKVVSLLEMMEQARARSASSKADPESRRLAICHSRAGTPLHFATLAPAGSRSHTVSCGRFQREIHFSVTRGRWHEIRITRGMLVAVPNCQGRVSPVFDVAARLLLVRLKGPVELERKDVVMFEKEPASIVRSLRELEIKVLICGGISQWLQVSLEQAGIEVVSHICGELEPVLAAYRAGRLNRREFLMPGCGSPCRVGRHGRRRSKQRIKSRCGLVGEPIK